MSRRLPILLTLLLAPAFAQAIEVARKVTVPGAPAPQRSEEQVQCEAVVNQASDTTERVCLTPAQKRSLARSTAARREPAPAGPRAR